MQISHVALVDDVEHAARREAQRRDDGQRHERKRHKRVDPARDAELEGLLLGIFERFVDLDERRFAHDARDLELDLAEHLAVLHHDDAAAERDDAVNRRRHVLFVRTDDDDIVAVVRDGRCHRAGLEAVALDIADANVVRVLVALDDGNFQDVVLNADLFGVARIGRDDLTRHHAEHRARAGLDKVRGLKVRNVERLVRALDEVRIDLGRFKRRDGLAVEHQPAFFVDLKDVEIVEVVDHDKVREEAKKFEGMTVSEEDCKGRMDLRALPIFTIDSAETKDIDDAISLTRTPEGGFELGVHIADVSNYVKPGSELNEEAFNRATSVYYADQVVPMLPKSLSNGICSLNEKELRLAFSCLMRLDKDGNLTDYRFVKSVICSRVKGVYAEINALLAGTADAEIQAKYAEVADQLPAMKELYAHRARLRTERGCIDFESGEVKLILDEDGHCIDVKKRTSGESEAMIEEFMLLANQCAAHFARVKQIPFVYRVHEEPNGEKLERLQALLQACGINDHFAKEVPTPKELSAILEGVRGGPYEQIINTGMLRCMSKAVYEEKPKGHYGLVLQDYAHFTSPIRRYPDLAIHRIMTAQLKGTDKDTMILRYSEFAEDVSKQASEREVIAMQIERKAEDCYKAEYARRHLGECYEGIISGVTQRGLFIELENGVEGFVPASSLTPTGTMLTEGIRLSDPVSGKNWNLGDSMMITIVRADVNLGKIDFEVAPEEKQ